MNIKIEKCMDGALGLIAYVPLCKEEEDVCYGRPEIGVVAWTSHKYEGVFELSIRLVDEDDMCYDVFRNFYDESKWRQAVHEALNLLNDIQYSVVGYGWDYFEEHVMPFTKSIGGRWFRSV